MRVLVTGATGFLGNAVITAALADGHDVLALHRPATSPTLSHDHLTWLSVDLRQPGNLAPSFAELEAVIHCASATSGDFSTQLAGTVLATENLLAALPQGLQRFVHVSSFSVYDFDKPAFYGVLSEGTHVESRPQRRDAYTQTKLIQERLVRDCAHDQQIPLVVARPGAIYGPGKTWGYGASTTFKRLDFIFAPLSKMRLIHVDNCAEALVAALTAPVVDVLVVNLVDAEQPSHWRFHKLARRAGARTGVAVPIPYAVVKGLGAAAKLASWLFFKGRARLPEMLDPPRQRVRWRPLRYSRDRAETTLGVRQRVSLATGVARIIREQKTSTGNGGLQTQ